MDKVDFCGALTNVLYVEDLPWLCCVALVWGHFKLYDFVPAVLIVRNPRSCGDINLRQ